MLLFDLQAKLKRLNSRLYVNTENRSNIKDDIYSCGVYLSYGTRGSVHKDAALVENATQKYLERVASGEAEYLGGVSATNTPEYDIFDLETGKLLIKGWRSLILSLVNRNICSLSAAQRIFNCKGLGETTYDKMSFEKKLAWARQEGRHNALLY